jgi:hypothetical protein
VRSGFGVRAISIVKASAIGAFVRIIHSSCSVFWIIRAATFLLMLCEIMLSVVKRSEVK